jgi:hypothetical protein
VATFTDWHGTTMEVVDTWFEQMRLRQGSSIRTLNPAEVVELKVFENPWPVYDQQQLEGQWLDAEVTTVDVPGSPAPCSTASAINHPA